MTPAASVARYVKAVCAGAELAEFVIAALAIKPVDNLSDSIHATSLRSSVSIAPAISHSVGSESINMSPTHSPAYPPNGFKVNWVILSNALYSLALATPLANQHNVIFGKF